MLPVTQRTATATRTVITFTQPQEPSSRLRVQHLISTAMVKLTLASLDQMAGSRSGGCRGVLIRTYSLPSLVFLLISQRRLISPEMERRILLCSGHLMAIG